MPPTRRHCRLAALALGLSALALSRALPAPGAEETPRIVFTETVHDFGEVEEGIQLRHVFRFRNEGGGVLEAKGG